MRRILVTFVLAVFLAACATQKPVVRPGAGPAAKPGRPAVMKAGKGYVVCKGSDFTGTFFGENQSAEVAGKANQPVEIAAGKYSIADLTFTAKDANGGVWKISRPGMSSNIAVEAGKTTDLTLGPPFKLAVAPNKTAGSVDFSVVIKGGADEVYPIGNIKNDRGQTPTPKVKIQDESGKVLTESAFRFG